MAEPRAEDNVVSLLRAAARKAPDHPALVLGEAPAGAVSFASLVERVSRTAAGLAERGLGAGDRAVLLVPFSLDLYVALMAVLELGAVAVFVDPWVGFGRLAAFARRVAPRAFLGSPRSHLLRLAHRPLRAAPLAVTTGRRLGPLPAPWTLDELAAGSRGGGGPPAPVEPGDPALVTFTTGSSGRPKGVDRTHGFLAAQHRALSRELPVEGDDVDMTMFPVFSLHNLAGGVPTVLPPMDLRCPDAVDPARVLARMLAWKVTTCTASPPFFDRLAGYLTAGTTAGRRLSLRRIVTGGAPVEDRQLRRWRTAFPEAEIVIAYGSTEAEPVARLTAEERLAATSEARPRAPGYCVGRPCPGVETRLLPIEAGPVTLGPEGWRSREVEPGGIGELAVTGEHVCKAYFASPEAARENKVVDGGGAVWHRMGDTGYFDGAGRFWLTGRVHSTIFRDGEAVQPLLLEQAAAGADPRVRRAAALGLADGRLGERVLLVVESPEGQAVAPAVAAALERAGLTADRVVVTRRPLPVDPRHASKIDYRRLRRHLRRWAGAAGVRP